MKLASLHVEAPVGIIQCGQTLGEHGMIERVTLDPQRDQAVDPGRLNAAPGAVGVLMPDDPLQHMARGRGAPETYAKLASEVLQRVQRLVGAAEEGVPTASVGPFG